MKKLLVFFLSCALINTSSWADLYSALGRVYETNPVINQGRSTVDVAYADVKSAATHFQPYLGVSGNIGAARTQLGDYTFDYSPLQYGAEFQQTLFQGGANWARFKGAKSILAAQQANLYAIQQSVFLDAINAYIGILNTDAVLRLNENNQSVLNEYLTFVRDQNQVGRLTKTDVAQASARLEMSKYAVADARAQYDNALETYRRIYGDIEHDYDDIDLNPIQHLFPQTINEAEDVALRNHPVLVALNAQEQAVKQNMMVAYQSMLPSVDVRGAIQQIDDVPYMDKLRDSRIGLYVKVPLYDKGNAFANSDKVRANIAAVHDEIQNARRVIIEQLRSAWNMYSAQEYAIGATKASVDANKMALDGIRDEQMRGRRTVLDVLNAEQELLNSRVAHTRAKHARIIAYFSVLAAMGRLSPENLMCEK